MMTVLRQPGPGDRKLLGLELLRFVAAFAVLVWHFQHFAFDGAAITVARTQQPFYALLWPFYEYGWYGVQVFWSISGFIFFWRYRNSVTSGAVSGWPFFVLRFSRLYPLHVLTLLMVALLQWVYGAQQRHFFVYQHNDAYHFVLQLFLASHWGLQTGYSFNGPIWSISVEALVYLVFFASLRLAGRSSLLNVGAVALCVVLKAAGMPTPVTDCLGLFYGGGLAAVLFLRELPAASTRLVRRAALAIALGAPLLTWAAVRAPSDGFLYYFLLAYLPVALYCLAQPVPVGPAVARAIETAGNLTYSSYLVHFPLQLLIALYFARRGQPIPLYRPGLFLFFIGVTGIVAYLSYRYLELPTQTWLRRRMAARVATAPDRAD